MRLEEFSESNTRHWRGVRVALIVAVLGATLSGCGAISNSAPSSVRVGHGVTVVVPAGANFKPSATSAPGADSTLLAQVALGHSKKGPSPFTVLIAPVHLKAAGHFPRQGVELRFHVKLSTLSRGATPFVATYDPASKGWHPVPSSFNVTTGVVSAHVEHFSLWGVFALSSIAIKTLAKGVFSSLFGSIKVTDPAPVCSDSNGLSAVESPSDGVLEVCAQNDGGTLVTLKIRSFLAFPVDVVPPKGTKISVAPQGGIFEQIGGYLNKVGTGESTRTLVAAGSEADLTLPIAADQEATVISDLDTEAYLASIIDSGVSLLTVIYARLGGNPKAALDAISQGTCLAEATQYSKSTGPLSVSELSTLTHVAYDCASAVLDLGTADVIKGIIATAVNLIENVLQTGFLGAMIIVGGIAGATSTIKVSRVSSDVLTAVPVNVCATTNYGIPPGSTFPKMVPSIKVSLPPNLTVALAAYVGDSGGPMTLAPSGWTCTAIVGGDGTTKVLIKEPSDPSAIVDSYMTYGTGPMYGATCPYLEPFPDPMESSEYGPCQATLPNYESETKLNASEAIFKIPAGDGTRASSSGGLDTKYAIEGLAEYLPGVQGSGVVSCALPPAWLNECAAVISAFRGAFG